MIGLGTLINTAAIIGGGIALKKNSSSHCQKPAESACFLSRVHILFHTRISF